AAQGFFGQLRKIDDRALARAEPHGTPYNAPRRVWDKPHDGETRHRLARPGFAYDRQRFSGVDRKRDVVDRLNQSVVRHEMRREMDNFEKRRIGHGDLHASFVLRAHTTPTLAAHAARCPQWGRNSRSGRPFALMLIAPSEAWDREGRESRRRPSATTAPKARSRSLGKARARSRDRRTAGCSRSWCPRSAARAARPRRETTARPRRGSHTQR